MSDYSKWITANELHPLHITCNFLSDSFLICLLSAGMPTDERHALRLPAELCVGDPSLDHGSGFVSAS